MLIDPLCTGNSFVIETTVVVASGERDLDWSQSNADSNSFDNGSGGNKEAFD